MPQRVTVSLSDILNGTTDYPSADTVQVTGSRRDFESLTPEQIRILAAKGADIFQPSYLFHWNWEQVSALNATNIVFHPNGYKGILLDTAARISSLMPDQIKALASKGFTLLSTGGIGSIVFSIDQLKASTSLNENRIGILHGNSVTLLDTSSNLDALSLDELGLLRAQGVTLIDSKENKLSLSMERLDKLGSSIKFAAEDEVSVSGSSAELANLLTDKPKLKIYSEKGVKSLDATNAVTLNIEQATNLAHSGLRHVAEDSVTVAGSVGSFTADQLAALGAKGVDVLDANSSVMLTYVQAAALAGTSMVFAADDNVTVSDNAANLAHLKPAQITQLARSGIDTLDSTTNVIALTSDQFAALGPIQFAVGDNVAISWMGTTKGNTISGTRFDDSINGLAGNDRLVGGDGNDKLSGGTGYDLLTGGSGSDTFIFNAKLRAKDKPDRIVDFDYRKDFVALESSIFTKLGKNNSEKPVSIKKGFFKVAPEAGDSNDYLLFNSKTKMLSCDQDGSGKTYKPIPIAALQKGAHLTAADILLI
jgi:hypothetical protein